MWIGSADQPNADDQHHGGIGAAHPPVHCRDGCKDVFGIDRQLAALLQFVGEDVKQDFRVGIGVDVAQIGTEQLFLEFGGVGQVAVVGQGDAKG